MIYAQKLIEKMQAIIDDEEKQDGWESFLEILEWAIEQRDIDNGTIPE